MTLDARRSGDAIAAASEDLARLWRSAVAHSGREVWPGLIDGLVDDLFARVGRSLAGEADPALVWADLLGVVRLDARDLDRSRAELDAEWDVLAAVLTSACDALSSGDGVRDWLARAVAASRAGARALGPQGGPRGLLVVWWLSATRPAAAPAREPR